MKELIDGSWLASRPPAEIKSPPLTLCRASLERLDLADAAVAASYRELREFMPWAENADDPVVRRAGLESYYRDEIPRWDTGQSFPYIIVLEGDDGIAGGIGAHNRVEPGVLEIGYWMRSDLTGRGLMTRAVKALTAELFKMPEIVSIRIENDLANGASGAIPRKLGFEYEGEVEARSDQARSTTGTNRVWTMPRGTWASL